MSGENYQTIAKPSARVRVLMVAGKVQDDRRPLEVGMAKLCDGHLVPRVWRDRFCFGASCRGTGGQGTGALIIESSVVLIARVAAPVFDQLLASSIIDPLLQSIRD